MNWLLVSCELHVFHSGNVTHLFSVFVASDDESASKQRSSEESASEESESEEDGSELGEIEESSDNDDWDQQKEKLVSFIGRCTTAPLTRKDKRILWSVVSDGLRLNNELIQEGFIPFGDAVEDNDDTAALVEKWRGSQKLKGDFYPRNMNTLKWEDGQEFVKYYNFKLREAEKVTKTHNWRNNTTYLERKWFMDEIRDLRKKATSGRSNPLWNMKLAAFSKLEGI